MQLSMPLGLLRDPAFQHRVRDRLADSAQQVRDGWPRQLRLETWMLPSSSGLGWKHMENPQFSQQKILYFSRSWNCLVHLACHLFLCCPLPEWVEGLLHGWWRHQNCCSL